MKTIIWGAALAVGLLVAGCVQTDDDYYYDAGFPPAPGGDTCARGCNNLTACGYCELDEAGYCLAPYDCAEQCRAFGQQRTYSCLASLSRCDQLQIQACYDNDFRPPPDDPPAPGNDGCAEGCNALWDCELCVVVEGECLPRVECAIECRAAEQEDEYQCLADQRVCSDDLVDICFSEGPPPSGPCEDGCNALDGCGLCWPDDDGACLDLAGCVDECEAGGTPIECYGELESCEAEDIDACSAPQPTCESLCAIFDEGDCAGCLTANRACVETAVCVSACEDDPALATCLAGVDSCQDEAVLDCPGVQVPDREDMGVGDMGAGDMGVEDMGVDDMGLDGGDPDMGSVDMAPVDMGPPGDSTADMAPVDMGPPEPVDMAPVDAQVVDAAPPPDCPSACAALAGCEPCLPNAAGDGCLTGVECATLCVGSDDQPGCAEAIAACDADGLAAACR